MADTGWLKGYEASSPDNTTPFMPEDDVYRAIGEAATQYKARWRNRPTVFPDAIDEGKP